MSIINQTVQCPNAQFPYAHSFDTLYVGEDKPSRLYCKQCGQVRETEVSPVDATPGDDRQIDHSRIVWSVDVDKG